MSLVFYDTETTGTETKFDQVLQFAAIKTDADLNELDRFHIRCRLSPHIVPSPGAMRVTRVRASLLRDPSLPSHYEMVRAIRSKLQSWSPSLFAGWNTIPFDEHLIRQALYKTLHNPYLTNSAGNSRTDIMRVAQASSLASPGSLIFPTGDRGQLVFKLDRLAPANGFNHAQAHDAMGDVEATIFVCRLLAQRAPQIWSSFMRFSTKAAVADYISDETLFCFSDFYFGRPFSFMVTALRPNNSNGTEWYVFDLSVDPESLMPLPERQLAARLNATPKPVRRVKTNAAPMIFPADEAPPNCGAVGLGLEELTRRAEWVKSNPDFGERLVIAFESLQTPFSSSPHVEEQIYEGFFPAEDESLMEEFHQVDWPERLGIVQRFQDHRLRTLGLRLIHLERPDLFEEHLRRDHDVAAANRLLGTSGGAGWTTLQQAISELKTMIAGAAEQELEFFQEHQLYLRERHEWASRHAETITR